MEFITYPPFLVAGCRNGRAGQDAMDGVFTGAPRPYLLFLNNVIPEDQVLDKESLPKVTMPIGDEFGKPHEFRLNAPSLKGYPY